MAYPILTDDDLDRVLSYERAIEQIEAALREHAAGTLNAPPRFYVGMGTGDLVFTVGAGEQAHAAGFRVYTALPGSHDDRDQIVAVFDSHTGKLRGLVLGNQLGAIRTGAIGGTAIKHMARLDARVLGIIGTGRQARTQIEAAAAARPLERIRVYSRTPAARDAFAAEMQQRNGIPVEAVDSPEAAVRGADIVIGATNSRTPVLDAAWIAPGTHVSTIGPKFAAGHEMPLDLAPRCAIIATDSPAQIDAYPEPYFLSAPDRARTIPLSAIVTGQQPGRTSPDDITLFCSVGLAGTEVFVALAALDHSA
ncbi:MAG TPA: ornithine cyclodeaminase family protein [Aggregatilinea sp.]|uniref:ornithine cyclodeaminase family protein n=1 Tax=Aggregatilinea sp. TaxID=2806333 RepID=UPI002BCA8FCF|nr:ornithine cyclodeaminase family protein [Aggregatilinea sp.]HML22669.1 ornithine cyclodeaminase family protein [Aggregatilinea sp.]